MLAHSATLYGLSIQSCWPLPSAGPGVTTQHIEIRETELATLRARAGYERAGTHDPSWFAWRRAHDGAVYMSWRDGLDAAVSPDHRTVEVAPAHRNAPLMLADYLLPQILSFPLIHFGIEPLHASAVAIPAGAIGFLGESGAGKSTVAAAFVAAGYRLCTDDVLALRVGASGMDVTPGPRHIRLFPWAAAGLISPATSSRPMNAYTRKRVYDIAAEHHCSGQVPLRALYVLETHRRSGPSVEIHELASTAAFHALLRNTFNPLDSTPERLPRQMEFYARLVSAVPIRRVLVRRGAAAFPQVVRRVTEDAFGSAPRS